MVALGFSAGRRLHSFELTDLESPLVRDEDRIEAVLGVDYRHKYLVARLSLMPYYVVYASSFAPVECSFGDCITAYVQGYQQTFGLSLVLSLALALHAH